MKRQLAGGAHRGPVGPLRQRRTIRFVQLLLIALAVGLFLSAGYAWGEKAGYERARAAEELGAPREPSAMQIVALVLLGSVAVGGALLLQGRDGVRLPTPARLDELAGRAERAAVERAQRVADEAQLEPEERPKEDATS